MAKIKTYGLTLLIAIPIHADLRYIGVWLGFMFVVFEFSI
jgi:hypothetical protein